jgi:type IX secretion system substrate protein
MIKYYSSLFLLTFFTLSTSVFSMDKNHKSLKVTPRSVNCDEYIIDTGDLVHYISNNTKPGYNYEQYTFTLGNVSDTIPSMSWRVGGYYPNEYLTYGAFFIGCNNDIVRFSTKTSKDFKVITSEPGKIGVRFSMTDDSTESYNKYGVKCISNIYAYYDDFLNDCIVYEYTIINLGDHLLENIYTGLLIDGGVSSAEGGGGSSWAYTNDDLPDYYLGIDKNGNRESISYMYDSDGSKESLGYIGSRVLKCPETKHGVPADQQSGHLWWSYSNDPDPGVVGELYTFMKLEEFQTQPGFIRDWKYFQSMGPWDLDVNDTIKVAFGLGIGEGLNGLRKNLQYTYNVYKSIELAPAITYYFPQVDTVTTYVGETIKFCLKSEENMLYRWGFNDYLLGNYDSTYTFKATKFHLGENLLYGKVSDNHYSRGKQWILFVKPSKKYELRQNYPNPFNGVTTIPFELEKDGNVNITIYDVLGRKVKTLINKPYTFGKHEFIWDGLDVNGKVVSSGIYFYQIISDDFSKAKRLLLLR